MRLLSLAVPLPPLDIFPGRGGKTTKRAPAGAGRRPAARRRTLPRVDGRLAAVALLTLGLSAGSAWLINSGLLDRGVASSHSSVAQAGAAMGLTVQNVMVEGRNRTDGRDILMALNVQSGAPILDLDMQAAREALEALPWVSRAVVSRRLPDTVHVHIEERTPIALWQREDGQFMLTDATGAAIPVQDVGSWSHLPVIVGTGAPAEARALFALLNKEPALAPRVKAATRRGDRRWDILLDDFERGVTVKLPEHGAEAAWARMARMEHDHRMLENDLAEIDLRMTDRVVVRLNGDGIPVGDRLKGGPKLKALPLPATGGREA